MCECPAHYFCTVQVQNAFSISVSVSVFDRNIISEMGEIGILGPTIKGECEPLVCALFTLHTAQDNCTYTK